MIENGHELTKSGCGHKIFHVRNNATEPSSTKSWFVCLWPSFIIRLPYSHPMTNNLPTKPSITRQWQTNTHIYTQIKSHTHTHAHTHQSIIGACTMHCIHDMHNIMYAGSVCIWSIKPPTSQYWIVFNQTLSYIWWDMCPATLPMGFDHRQSTITSDSNFKASDSYMYILSSPWCKR